MLLKFRLLRSPDIFWNHASWSQKEEISRSTLSTSTSALDSLIVEVSESRPFYSNFVRLALVVFCPLASLAGLVSSSSFNHSSWLQCDPRSLRAKNLVRRWTRFSPLGLLRRRKLARSFRPDIKKIWQERKLTCDETTRSRTVRVHKLNITPQ